MKFSRGTRVRLISEWGDSHWYASRRQNFTNAFTVVGSGNGKNPNCSRVIRDGRKTPDTIEADPIGHQERLEGIV